MMVDTAIKLRIPRYVIVSGVILAGCVMAIVTAFIIEDRKDKAIAAQLGQTQSELRMLGAQITSIKDADLTTTNDFIAAYAQVEPLEKEYEAKLQQFSDLYRQARERDSNRSIFDPQRYRSRHHPETWEKVSEIIGLIHQINDLTKREISVVHAMASLPEPERMRFWHEQFMPLAAQEHALREQLQAVGESRPPDSSVQ
jgi:hypothetical protein